MLSSLVFRFLAFWTRRVKPKKCIAILGGVLLFTCSLFFLNGKVQKLGINYKDGESEQIDNKVYLLEEISELPKDSDHVTNQNSEQRRKHFTTLGYVNRQENVVKYIPRIIQPNLNEKDAEQKRNKNNFEEIEMLNFNSYSSRKIKPFDKTSAKYVSIPNAGLDEKKDGDIIKNNKRKHLLILGHYEQLGKTTVNFIEAAKFAYLTERNIVKPLVRNSRFCGLHSGWTGVLRSATRAFFPLDLYYHVSSMQDLFRAYKLADMEYLQTFKESCSYDNGKRMTRVIYFMFERKDNQKVLSISNEEENQIEKSLNESLGWTDCSFINERIKIDERIGGNIKIGKQYCVDPNRVTDLYLFENKILQNDPCVIIHQWRGIGSQRLQFNLMHLVPFEVYLKNLRPSDFVQAEVQRFLDMIGGEFIGIHIRSERQLLWYGLNKYSRCMDFVYKEAKLLKKSKNIQKIFLSADVGPYGSDQINPNFDSTEIKVITKKYEWLASKLHAVTFSPIRSKHHIWTDSGLVALIQLHILSHASYLITLGSGTFQKWMTNTFKARKASQNDQSWSITRTCFNEKKTRSKSDRQIHSKNTKINGK
eukprot:gene8194-9073_t